MNYITLINYFNYFKHFNDLHMEQDKAGVKQTLKEPLSYLYTCSIRVYILCEGTYIDMHVDIDVYDVACMYVSLDACISL